MQLLRSSFIRSGSNNYTNAENTCALTSSSLYISNMPQNKGGNALLLIDPQNDFILPAPEGSLSVDGATEDSQRIAKFIRDNINKIEDIYVTLDSHMKYHIAHPTFWVNEQGEHPGNFQEITHEDVLQGVWVPAHKEMTEWAKHYTKQLTKSRIKGVENLNLTIWPEHCRIGTPGHNVYEVIQDALTDWEAENKSSVHYIIKGNNSKTEHYSAFKAEVIVNEDPDTKFNQKLYNDLMGHSKIYVGGEAKSHCVNYTVRDLVRKMGKQSAGKKLVLLEDCMSSVSNFESVGDVFINDMKKILGDSSVLKVGNGLELPSESQPDISKI